MASPGTDTPYCTAAELKPYIDKRALAQLVCDGGTNPYFTPPNTWTGDPFTDTAVLPPILLAACGTVESACLVGAKYTADELDNLPAASKQHMIRIIAGLIMDTLRGRRTEYGTSDKQLLPASWAQKELDKLRNGTRIFSIPSVQDARAGMSTRDETPTARVQRNDIVIRNRRYYGIRGY